MSSIDSKQVDEFLGKFTGTFPMDDDEGETIQLDDVVTFVVSGVVGGAGHKYNRSGDIVRTNSFSAEEVTVVPIGKVAALKSALASDGSIEAMFASAPTPTFDLGDEYDEEEELSV